MQPSVPIRQETGSRSAANPCPAPSDPMTLLGCFLDILAPWETVFPQARTFRRDMRWLRKPTLWWRRATFIRLSTSASSRAAVPGRRTA